VAHRHCCASSAWRIVELQHHYGDSEQRHRPLLRPDWLLATSSAVCRLSW